MAAVHLPEDALLQVAVPAAAEEDASDSDTDAALDLSPDDCVWTFEGGKVSKGNAMLREGGRCVVFHPQASHGTATVRGMMPMSSGVHSWCIKMGSSVYGTDMMVGICTGEFDVDEYVDNFCSMLGQDQRSWGFSYLGYYKHPVRIHSANTRSRYLPEDDTTELASSSASEFGHGRPPPPRLPEKNEVSMFKGFSAGSEVTLVLDMTYGCLSVSVDGQEVLTQQRLWEQHCRPHAVYPAVCSTAARTRMTLLWCREQSIAPLEELCRKTLLSSVRSLDDVDALQLPSQMAEALKATWLHAFSTEAESVDQCLV